MKCETCQNDAKVHVPVIDVLLCEPCRQKIDHRIQELNRVKDLESNRSQFEQWISAPPYERDIYRWPQDENKHAWPGQYKDITVEVAWEAWQEARKS